MGVLARVGVAVALAGTMLAASSVAGPTEALADPYRPPGSDFNGDGYQDQAIGAANATINGRMAAGYFAVVYGGSRGLNTTKRQVISQDSPGVPGTSERLDDFGNALAAGDFNGDGYDDLAVAAPQEGLPGGNYAGSVTVLFGGSNGLGQAFDGLSMIDHNRDGRVDVTAGAAEENNTGGIWLLNGTSSGPSASGVRAFGPKTIGAPAWGALFGDELLH